MISVTVTLWLMPDWFKYFKNTYYAELYGEKYGRIHQANRFQGYGVSNNHFLQLCWAEKRQEEESKAKPAGPIQPRFIITVCQQFRVLEVYWCGAEVIIPVLGDIHSYTFHLQEIFNTFKKNLIKNFWTRLWLELKSSEWKISRNRVGDHWCRGIMSWHTLSLLIPLKLINVAEMPRNSYNITYMTCNHGESALRVSVIFVWLMNRLKS